MIDLPLTLSVTILLRMSWLLTVHRYCPASVGLTSLIWRFHSFVCGRTTVNRMSSVTRFSSNVNGYEPRSSQATFRQPQPTIHSLCTANQGFYIRLQID